MSQTCQLDLKQLCTGTPDLITHMQGVSLPGILVLSLETGSPYVSLHHKFFTFLLDKISKEKRRWE